MSPNEVTRLGLLIPEARLSFLALRQHCRTEFGFDLFLGSTLRTKSEQKAAFTGGHSSQVISWHMFGRGMDCYPIVGGKSDLDGHDVEKFREMHEIGDRNYIGLTGIAFNADGSKRYIRTPRGPVWDGGHLEFRGGYFTLADAVRAEGSRWGIA